MQCSENMSASAAEIWSLDHTLPLPGACFNAVSRAGGLRGLGDAAFAPSDSHGTEV